MEALEQGDAICLFPEGFSRYHPTMAPLKTGVARIVSDVLSRNRDDPEFAVTVLTCSLTYVHRHAFRSDVLVSFNPPLRLTVKDTPSLVATPNTPVNFEAVKSLTAFMHAQLSSNTIDSPSWDLIRIAKTAARIYVPLGTRMRLGDWVRVVARFVEGFAVGTVVAGEGTEGVAIERKGLTRTVNWDSKSAFGSPEKRPAVTTENIEHIVAEGQLQKDSEISDAEREQLARDLTAYQDHLNALGLKDDRIRQSENVARMILLGRLVLRVLNTFLLLLLALPGLILWLPIFITTAIYVRRLRSSGPLWDTQDEVAQTKLVYGLASGIVVWGLAVIFTLPIFNTGLFLTMCIVPAWMWLTLRWTEDLVSAFRASLALYRLLRLGKAELKRTREIREDLHGRVVNLATIALGLPANPEDEFLVIKGEDGDDHPSRWGKHQRGRSKGGWDSALRYFSIRRRRKRDWNETLRWFDATEFPKE
ncbi:hypothetical protein FRB99_005149 [Tulasnella sp. 403]|nr:hypothetical protein FRB99_005149 [Tulasnella sp. 403]